MERVRGKYTRLPKTCRKNIVCNVLWCYIQGLLNNLDISCLSVYLDRYEFFLTGLIIFLQKRLSFIFNMQEKKLYEM